MGVFSMFRRKKKDPATGPSEETGTGAGAPTADGDGDGTEAGSGVGAAEVVALDEDEAAEVDVVEIPKQQSVEAAADNEAGEGARA
ncbi:hypothetical protein EAO70_33500 [Streptomyces sp. adm13(2018)]|uniref:hypothetical protein n=2 Tax=unclassified Streptomyces TaxID=2593676 RepID=UPI0011CE13B3|nr:hypothetical protein [Streptomyces sp. adm13(2018)]TXS11793.1 hypothetical protein EAO70_33500 [Streptomyces sp. adm13(2018)]